LTSSTPPSVAHLRAIEEELNGALRQAGRKAGAVTVTAVAKTHGADAVRPLLEAGHRVFGENRVQEAMAKWPALKADYADVELRLVGPLQSNKAKEAVALFDVIETVDRPKIVRRLAVEMETQGRTLGLLVQVNTGQEPQKAGVTPADADAFLAECRKEFGLEMDGLMCIPPAGDDPAAHFALLAKIAERNGLKTLSMGMSADYAAAARLGATHVRVGTAIFGPREPRA